MLLEMLRDLFHRVVSTARALPGWPVRPGAPRWTTQRHALGAGALVRDAEGRVLLIQQTYQRPPVWLPPGGWVDRGETPHEAACREVREELGVPVRIGRALAARSGGYGEVTILFEAIRLNDAVFTFSDEILRAEFFAPDALPPMPEIVRSYIQEAVEALPANTPRSGTSADGAGSSDRAD